MITKLTIITKGTHFTRAIAGWMAQEGFTCEVEHVSSTGVWMFKYSDQFVIDVYVHGEDHYAVLRELANATVAAIPAGELDRRNEEASKLP